MNKVVVAIIIIALIAGGIFLVARNNRPSEKKPNSYQIEGMKVEILKEGSGEEAKNGQEVAVHYVGTLENGTKFDSSRDRGTPLYFTLGVGQVIRGWDLGVFGMKVGEQRRLTIPPEMAYGQSGVPGSIIGPNATLIFEVELLAINR